jgi:hypothetical protein
MQHLTNTGLDDNGIFTRALGSMQPLVPQIMVSLPQTTLPSIWCQKRKEGAKKKKEIKCSLSMP